MSEQEDAKVHWPLVPVFFGGSHNNHSFSSRAAGVHNVATTEPGFMVQARQVVLDLRIGFLTHIPVNGLLQAVPSGDSGGLGALRHSQPPACPEMDRLYGPLISKTPKRS